MPPATRRDVHVFRRLRGGARHSEANLRTRPAATQLFRMDHAW